MSNKMSKMLRDVVALLQGAEALQVNYTNCVYTLGLVSQDTSRAVYDLEMIRATELRMNQDHQNMVLQLQGYIAQVNYYQVNGINPIDHMNLLVLGENITQWTDLYNAVVVGPSINLMSHIQNAQPLTV